MNLLFLFPFFEGTAKVKSFFLFANFFEDFFIFFISPVLPGQQK